jgi:hypothetical protein
MATPAITRTAAMLSRWNTNHPRRLRESKVIVANGPK